MKNKENISGKKGFTLVEALIASSIFAMVAVTGATIFINMSQSERKTELTNALYEDARIIVEKLAKEIRNGTVDYEEYYNIEVLKSGIYGINRGVYASRFYNPGSYINDSGNSATGLNPKHLGAQCVDENKATVPCDSDKWVYPLSVDKDTGKNPYTATSLENAASAFCDTTINSPVPCLDNKFQDELYLISEDGKKKTIIVNQKIGIQGNYALSILSMEALDLDKNGIMDIFTCEKKIESYCTADKQGVNRPDGISIESIKLPEKHNDTIAFNMGSSPFTPFSPLRSNIKNLKFMIYPDEDPNKAFSEPLAQFHPSVTILMTLEPSSSELENYPGQETPSVTIQTTISAGARAEIRTYPPTEDISWIDNISAL